MICSTTKKWQVIQDLDFDPIKVKLMDKEEGLGWSLDKCDEAEKQYKRFLYLGTKLLDSPLVPIGDVDKFWHQHILDTRKYADDCNKVFGYFLHHFPYFGLRGEEDAADLKRSAEETSKIFESEFGESLVGKASGCKPPSKCGASCFAYPSCYPAPKNSPNVSFEARPTLVRA